MSDEKKKVNERTRVSAASLKKIEGRVGWKQKGYARAFCTCSIILTRDL